MPQSIQASTRGSWNVSLGKGEKHCVTFLLVLCKFHKLDKAQMKGMDVQPVRGEFALCLWLPTVCFCTAVSQCEAPQSRFLTIFDWQILLCLHPHSAKQSLYLHVIIPGHSYLCIPQLLFPECLCCTELRATLVTALWSNSICKDPEPKHDILGYWKWEPPCIFLRLLNSAYNQIPLKDGVWLSKSFTNLIGFSFYFVGH